MSWLKNAASGSEAGTAGSSNHACTALGTSDSKGCCVMVSWSSFWAIAASSVRNVITAERDSVVLGLSPYVTVT